MAITIDVLISQLQRQKHPLNVFSVQVHLCEAARVTDFLEDDFLVNRTGSRSIMVAVKILRHDADDAAR